MYERESQRQKFAEIYAFFFLFDYLADIVLIYLMVMYCVKKREPVGTVARVDGWNGGDE